MGKSTKMFFENKISSLITIYLYVSTATMEICELTLRKF